MIWAIIKLGYIDDRGVSGYLKLGGQVVLVDSVDLQVLTITVGPVSSGQHKINRPQHTT